MDLWINYHHNITVIWYVTPCSLEGEGIVATLSRSLSLRPRIISERWLWYAYLSPIQCCWQDRRCFEILIDWCVVSKEDLPPKWYDLIVQEGVWGSTIILQSQSLALSYDCIIFTVKQAGQFVLCGWYESLLVVMCNNNSAHSRL